MTVRSSERVPIGLGFVSAILFGIAVWALAIAGLVWAFSGIFG